MKKVLDRKDDKLTNKERSLDSKEEALSKKTDTLNKREQELLEIEEKKQEELERIAALTKDEAKEIILSETRDGLTKEMGHS